MRLVLIEGKTYSVYEGRRMIAQYKADGPISPEEVEMIRNVEEDDENTPKPA